MKNTIKHPLEDTSSEGSLASGFASASAIDDDDGSSFHSSSSAAVDVSSWCKIRFRTTTAQQDGRDVTHVEDAMAICLTSDGTMKLIQTRQNEQKQGSSFTNNKSNKVVAARGFAVDASSGDLDQFVRPAATAHHRHHDGHDKIWLSQFDTVAEMKDVARHAADLGGLGLICSVVASSHRPDGAAYGDWGQLPLPVFLVVNSNDGCNNNNNSVSSLSMALATMKAGNSSITVEITMTDDDNHDNFEIAGGDAMMGDDGMDEESKPAAIRDEVSTDRPIQSTTTTDSSRQRRGNSFDDERNSKQLMAASSGSFPTLQETRGTSSSSSSSSPDDMPMGDYVNGLSNARSLPDDEIHYRDLDGRDLSALMGPVVTSVIDRGNAVEVMEATTAPVSWQGCATIGHIGLTDCFVSL
jgi:hypothetical protein